MTNGTRTTKKYFAAANSYNGFVCYFDKIFPSEKFDRVYVLKGGPGTGKSSLMRKFSSELFTRGCKIDEIYCSSDPNSLDGIIAESEKARIAIIDGTAPHERDAIIPGAIDEIINLGDNWEKRWLIANRTTITEIAKEKSAAYKTAYRYLKIAGEALKICENVYNSNCDKTEIKNKAEEILKNIIPCNNFQIDTKLMSSFGRKGNYVIDTFENTDKQIIVLPGDRYSSALLMDYCYSSLINVGTKLTVYPSALDPQKFDAIELHDMGVILKAENDETISADECGVLSPIDKERIKKAAFFNKEMLSEAARWFNIASELHFQLEEIYSRAMNFEKNDLIFDQKITEIENIL